jgi:hypothetical protein
VGIAFGGRLFFMVRYLELNDIPLITGEIETVNF